jgi:HK97 family phage portal protein
MSLLNRTRNAWNVLKGVSTPELYNGGTNWVNASIAGGKTLASKAELLAAYASWVYACVNVRAKALAGVTFRVNVKRGPDEYEEIVDHPLSLLLESPNPFYTRSELMLLLGQHLDLTGDGYWYIPRNGFGVPGEIWPLPPDKMKVVGSKTEFIQGYVLDYGTQKIQFKPEEIVHFRYPSPTDVYYGISPLRAAARSVNIDEYQHTLQENLLRKGGVPPIALVTEQTVTDPVRLKMKQDWRDNYGGPENAGNIPILSNGLKVEKIGLNPSEMDWLATSKATRDDILAIFGVPASKLGLVEDVNRANAEANDYTFSVNVVEPNLRLIDERMTRSLAQLFDVKLVIIHDSTIAGDERETAEVAKIRISAGMTTINEEREAEGYDPIEGGDEILVSKTMATLSSVIAGTASPLPAPDPNAVPNPEDANNQGATP